MEDDDAYPLEEIEQFEFYSNHASPDYILENENLDADPIVLERLVSHFKPSRGIPTPFLQDLLAKPSPPTGFLASEFCHPRDAHIVCVDKPHVFVEDGVEKSEDCHSYFIKGSCLDLISVTGFTHAFFKPFEKVERADGIIASATHLSRKNQPSYKYKGCKTRDDVFQKWNEWRDLGSALHNNIELYLNNISSDIDEFNKIPFAYFRDFIEQSGFCKWRHFRTEWPVFDEELALCGKIDYVGIDNNGHLIIIDWKRVDSLNVFAFKGEKGLSILKDTPASKLNEHSAQVNTYKYIIEKNYGFKVSAMHLLQLHPKHKTYNLFKCVPMQKQVSRMAALRKKVLVESRESRGVCI